MITYNHEAFIAQAIESVLVQKTDFPIEIVIGEDCSTDNTREIIIRYASLRPNIIRPILHDKNVGLTANSVATIAACRGDFVAIIEGDDYWTYPSKLQRQVQWLESNSGANFCFHNVDVVEGTSGNVLRRHCKLPADTRLGTLDLISSNPVPTCSVVFRRTALSPPSERVGRLRMQDWPWWIRLLENSYAGYIDEVWGAYRLHSGGAWSAIGTEKQYLGALDFYSAMLWELAPSYHPAIHAARKRLLPSLINILVQAGRWREAKPYVKEYLATRPQPLRPPPGQAMLYARILLNLPSAPMENPSVRTATRSAPEFDRTRAS